jgi:hypothetical protein
VYIKNNASGSASAKDKKVLSTFVTLCSKRMKGKGSNEPNTASRLDGGQMTPSQGSVVPEEDEDEDDRDSSEDGNEEEDN